MILKLLIEYSNDTNNIYKNIEEDNPNKKHKTFIIFDDLIMLWYDFADVLSNKELNPIVTKLFITGRKLNISPIFTSQSYFAVPKNIRLNSTHYCLYEKNICYLIGWEEYNIGCICTLWLNKK